MSSYGKVGVITTDRNEEAFLSLPETARMLGVSERTIHRWIHDGRLPVYKPGRAYRFRLSDIEAFLEEHRGGPLAQTPPEEERRSSKTVTGGAHLSGTGKLTAAGEVVARIMQIMDKRREEKISDEEVVEQIRELVAA